MQNANLLEVHTLGAVAIRWRGKTEAIPLAPREALLLIYLLYQRVPVSRAHLCQLFWPDEAAARAYGNLRKLLVDLRKSLEMVIVATREEVALHPDLQYWLDVHEFQWQMQPLGQVNKALAAGSEIDLPRLQCGLQLYRGEFLANYKLPKSRIFCAWLEQEQTHLHQQVISARKVLLAASKQKQHYGEAIHYAKQILDLDPFDEEAHEETMLLWVQMGNPDEALQHYQAYRQLLKQELTAKPELQLTRLYQQVRAGTASNAPPESKLPPVPSRKSAGRPFRPLPKPLTPLLGRAEMLAQLQRYLTDPAVRLVTLVGMGGIGKTHLALTLADQLTSHFADQIAFVALHDLPSVREVRRERQRAAGDEDGIEQASDMEGENQQAKAVDTLALATAMALQLPIATSDPLIQQISDYLREQQLLLVFDGFERLGAGTPFLIALLQAAPLLKVLVTARACLQLPGEVLVYLEGLPLPTHEDATCLLNDQRHGEGCNRRIAPSDQQQRGEPVPSLQLLTQCLQRQIFKSVLHPTCLQHIIQICHLVEGNPLAIELVAGLSSHYSWSEIAGRLQHDIDILNSGQRGPAHRHRSMTTVIADSWSLLSSQEQATLAGLSIFADTFSRKAAIAVTGSSPEILMALVNKSLVRSKEAGRYELPRLIRLFAAQMLKKRGNEEHKCHLQAAHATYYLEYLQHELEHCQVLTDDAVTPLLQKELSNLLNVSTWVHQHGSAQQRQQCIAILSTLRRCSPYTAARISTIS